MPGDAEHVKPISATTDHDHARVSSASGLTRSPAFLFGGGEAPKAQDAQGTLEDKEAVEDTPEAAEDLGAAEVGVDVDYVADVTTA